MFYNKRLIVLLTRTLYNESRIPPLQFAELPLVWLSGGESKGFKMRFILWGLEHRESDGGEEAHLGEIGG
jgi:hypothetical protein